MNSVWRAISAKLEADATLLALLGTGTNASIIGIHEAHGLALSNGTKPPFIVIAYDGSRAQSTWLSDQAWTIYVHHKGNPYVAGQILAKVKDALHMDTVSPVGVSCLEVEWFADIPSDFDPLFDTDVEGSRFFVHVAD